MTKHPEDKTIKPTEKRSDLGTTWARCGVHGVDYPRGGSCPQCDRERQQR